MKLFNDYWTKADQKALEKRFPMTPMDRWLVDHLMKRIDGDPSVPPLIHHKSRKERARITASQKRWRKDEEEKRRRLMKQGL